MHEKSWETIRTGIGASMAREVDVIRRNPPPKMDQSEWEKHIKFYIKEETLKRGAVNAENQKKNKVYSRHGSK